MPEPAMESNAAAGPAVDEAAEPAEPVGSEPKAAPVAAALRPMPAGKLVAQPAATDTHADTKAAPSDQAAREALADPSAATGAPDAVAAPASGDDATSLAGSAAAPEPVAPEPMLYRWVDKEGNVQFGENPPEEYAGSAVKVLDL
jgi:hypothetical protein